MLRLTKNSNFRPFWPKPSSVFKYERETPTDVGFTGENINEDSVNYLDQKFSKKRIYKTAIKQLDERRRFDIDMPIREEFVGRRQKNYSERESIASFNRLYDSLNCQGCRERCVLCNVPISWKNTQLLSQFISPWSGRIYERGVTNLCDKAYLKVKDEIQRSQDNGLLGRNYRPTEFNQDPNLSSFDYSTKMHSYRRGKNSKNQSLKQPAYEKSDTDKKIDELMEQEMSKFEAHLGNDEVTSSTVLNQIGIESKDQQFFFSKSYSEEIAERLAEKEREKEESKMDGKGFEARKRGEKKRKIVDDDLKVDQSYAKEFLNTEEKLDNFQTTDDRIPKNQ